MTVLLETPNGRLSATSTARLLPTQPGPSWPAHLGRLGPMPLDAPSRLVRELEAVGLRGRSGGGFPTARKFAAVHAASSRSRRPVVVVNACEGEPTSAKDKVLLTASPHLVVDGALLAAETLGADRIVIAVHRGTAGPAQLRAALAERPIPSPVSVVEVPARFIASEATALVNYLGSGDARPLGRMAKIWESGIDGRPTLVNNAETMAQLSLLGRFGADWFRQLGTSGEAGTSLVTIGGAARRPGVVEIPTGTPVGAVLATTGAAASAWALTGGLAGRWVWLPDVLDVGFSAAQLAAVGAHRGVGSIVVLPPNGCVLEETVRIIDHLAASGARQCGPCMFGLPAIAADLTSLSRGDGSALARLQRRLPVINGRGACAHPDGAVMVAASALQVLTTSLGGHLTQHLQAGPCHAPTVVPLSPGTSR